MTGANVLVSATLAAASALAVAAEEPFRMRAVCKQGYHYANKGGHGVPGNSLEAFKLAWQKGAKLIETDCLSRHARSGRPSLNGPRTSQGLK